VSTSTSALALRNAAPRQTDDDKDDYLRGAASIAAFVTKILGEPVAPQQIYGRRKDICRSADLREGSHRRRPSSASACAAASPKCRLAEGKCRSDCLSSGDAAATGSGYRARARGRRELSAVAHKECAKQVAYQLLETVDSALNFN
jgi:hypothetical protein